MLSETLLGGDDDGYEGGGQLKFGLNESEYSDVNQSIAPDADPTDLGEGLKELEQYKDIFNNLTDKHVIDLGENMAIVDIIISYDSSRAVLIARNEKPIVYLQMDDESAPLDEFYVFLYSLKSFRQKAFFKISGVYIRMNEIVQTDDAT